MAQSLEFSAQQGLTFTAIARSIGSFSGGTPADSVTHQSGTDRYLATFNTNLSAGSKRLDYFLGGVPFGSEIYDITAENGTFQPRSEVGIATVNAKLQTGQIAIVSPVNQDGSVNSIVIADDYLAANDRAFDFFIDPIAAFPWNRSCATSAANGCTKANGWSLVRRACKLASGDCVSSWPVRILRNACLVATSGRWRLAPMRARD